MVNIYVFGSNREGRHGKGSALVAKQQHGAIYGQAEGLQGNSYAIVTKELRRDYPPVTLDEVKIGVDKFLEFAKNNQQYNFNVVAIGCSLAGFSPMQIAPLFKGYTSNVSLPSEFLDILEDKSIVS